MGNYVQLRTNVGAKSANVQNSALLITVKKPVQNRKAGVSFGLSWWEFLLFSFAFIRGCLICVWGDGYAGSGSKAQLHFPPDRLPPRPAPKKRIGVTASV